MSASLSDHQKVRLGQAVILVASIAFLEWITRTGRIGAITLTPPSEITLTLGQMLASGAILGDVAVTGASVVVAFLLAAAIGIPVGWALWRWNVLQQVLDPYLIAFYAAPTFALYPLLIAIFGVNRIPIVLIAFVMSIVAIIINTANGFGNMPDVYHDAARSLRLSRLQTFRHIHLPAATPYIFTGLKLGFIYALIGVIASEFILADSGLGFQVSYDFNNFATNQMYAEMLLIIAIAVGANLILIHVENDLYRRSVSR